MTSTATGSADEGLPIPQRPTSSHWAARFHHEPTLAAQGTVG